MAGEKPQHIVAIVGGATAGAEAAGMLAERGVACVVFEQNPRPYGKIEDGLPRWHVRLRRKEYDIINDRLSRPGVHFVPNTKVGRDVDFPALVSEWGFTGVLLAHGAWRDRPLPIEGADAYLGRGLVYQNSFIYWFNHYPERGYSGPRYDVVDGAIVVGGGLASIDVMKALQMEIVLEALAERGIDEDMLHLEHEGIPTVLESHGFGWDELGVRGATLYYRRRIEDMPLAEVPEGADEARRQKFEVTRRKILEKAMHKYAFRVRPLMVPVGLIVEGDRLAGLRFQRTRIVNGQAMPISGEVEDVRAPLVVSSIGSIPEPMEGIAQDGVLYRFIDRDLGRLEGYDTVFSAGNVVTGKGKILDSRRHSVTVTTHVADCFLGLDGHAGKAKLAEAAAEVAGLVTSRPPLRAEEVERVLARVRARQAEVGYQGDYSKWIAGVTPPDLA
jgi:NADPH-dependent glutamate synthase beta subunit-like oxidoreductase